MKKGLKEFVEFIERRYEVALKKPNDFESVYSQVGAVLYHMPSREECYAIQKFFENSKFEFTGFSGNRMIVRKLSCACSGTGKNKMYLTIDHTLTQDKNKAMYTQDWLLKRTIKELKTKNPFLYKKLKIDYDTF